MAGIGVALVAGSAVLAGAPDVGGALGANLSVTQRVTGTGSVVANIGDRVTVQTSVFDSGPSTAVGVAVTETLPSGLAFEAASAPAGITYTRNAAVWTVGTMTPGETVTLTLVVQISGTTTPLDVTVTASAADAPSVAKSAVVDVNAALAVSMTASPGNAVLPGADGAAVVQAGRHVTFGITVANPGAATATGVAVSDDLPLTHVSVVALVTGSETASQGSASVATGKLGWAVGTLAPGAEATLSYTVLLQPGLTGATLLNEASATSDQTSAHGNSRTVGRSTGLCEVHVVSGAALTLTDTDGSTTVVPGTSDTYTLTVTNDGTSSTGNVPGTLTDLLPSGFTVTGSTSSLGGTVFTDLGNDQVEWTDITLARNATATFTVTGNVTPALGEGAFVDTARVSLPAQAADPGATATATDTDTVTPTADITVNVTDSNGGINDVADGVTTGGTVSPSSTAVYMVTIANASSQSTVAGLGVTDALPSGVASGSWTAASSGGASATGVSGTGGLADTLTLPPDSSVTFTVDDTVASNASGAIVDSATVTVPAGLTDTGGTTASDIISVDAATTTAETTTTAQLSLAETVTGFSTTIANVGDRVTITTTLGNPGKAAASNVAVGELLPPGLQFIGAATPSGTTYGPVTGVWSVGSLGSGAVAVLTVVAQVGLIGSTAPSSVSVTASASASNAPTVTQAASVTVNAAVAVSATASPGGTIAPGAGAATTVSAAQDVTYRVTVANPSANTASDVVVTAALPAAFGLDNSSFLLNNISIGPVDLAANGIVISGTTLTWTLSSLTAGATATLVYTETANSPSSLAFDPTTVTVTSAETSTHGNSPIIGRSEAEASVAVVPNASLTATVTDGTATVHGGTSDTYTLTVDNAGPSALTGATVTDVLPVPFTVTGSTASVGGTTFSNPGGGTVQWSGLDLAAGATATFTVTGVLGTLFGLTYDIVQVTPPAGLDSPAAVAVDADAGVRVADVATQVTDSVGGAFDAASSSTTGGHAVAGTSLTYTVKLSDLQPSNSATVTLSDVMPPGIASDSWSVASTPSNLSSATPAGGTGTVTTQVTLTPGSTLTVTIHATLAPSASGVLVDSADVTPGPSVTDTAASVTATDLVQVTPAPATAPGTTTITSWSVGDHQVTVQWAVPTTIGTSPVRYYVVTATPPGGPAVTTLAPATAQTATVTGLTNGVTYAVTVAAANAAGQAPPSPAVTLVPVAAPAAPGGLSAIAGNGQVALSWTGPSTDGGTTVTGYTVSVSPSCASCRGLGSTRTTSTVVAGLSNGTTYTLSVVAINSAGDGPAATVSATPAALPGAPTITSAVAGNGTVSLTWSPPATTGGLPILYYALSAAPTKGNAVDQLAAAGTRSATLTGLVAGTTYSVTVTAATMLGQGAPSSPATVTTVTPVTKATSVSYWVTTPSGLVDPVGGAPTLGGVGNLALNAPVVGMAATSDRKGYWLVAGDGGIFTFGDALFFGSEGGKPLNAPIVGMAADPNTGGYWEVAADGGVFAFTAPFFGSEGGKPLNAPIVAMAATPTAGGYWLVASDGGIFTFGNAQFYGSEGGKPLDKPVVAMAPTPRGQGYWLVASDGGIFTFGDAGFFGSEGGKALTAPVEGMLADPTGGYWLTTTDGNLVPEGAIVPPQGPVGVTAAAMALATP